MSFFIPTVEKCPIAKETKGLIEIDPGVISKLAGAVWEKDEWLAVALGEKHRDGLHVIVDGVYVPRGQYRTGGTCRVSKKENSMDTLPKEILRHVVGIVHSHNSMRARFSGTDTGEGGLNRTFPMSIVISRSFTQCWPEAVSLGFDYEAVVTFEAPCGALMRSPARIIPRGIADWPFMHEVYEAPTTYEEEGETKPLIEKDLEDCTNYDPSPDSNKYYLKRIGHCGMSESDLKIIPSVFGQDYDSIVRELPKAENNYQYQYKQQGSYAGGNSASSLAIVETPIDPDQAALDRWLDRRDQYDFDSLSDDELDRIIEEMYSR